MIIVIMLENLVSTAMDFAVNTHVVLTETQAIILIFIQDYYMEIFYEIVFNSGDMHTTRDGSYSMLA